MSNTLMIEGLSGGYGKLCVFLDVDFAIADGETVGCRRRNLEVVAGTEQDRARRGLRRFEDRGDLGVGGQFFVERHYGRGSLHGGRHPARSFRELLRGNVPLFGRGADGLAGLS